MTGLRHCVAPLVAARGVLVPIGGALLVTFGYFVAGPAWNQNSRLALTRALVERRSVEIDPDAATTGDRSRRLGHDYSDKAPGVSFVATIPYATLYSIRRVTGGELPRASVIPLDPDALAAGEVIEPQDRRPGDRLTFNRAWRLALYVCSLFAVAIPSVLGCAALYGIARVNLDHRPAVWLALVYALGTPALTYSTALYGHQLAAAALICAYAIIVATPRPARAIGPACAVGMLAGLAVLTEYPSAVAVALLIVLCGFRHGARFTAIVVAAGLPLAALLAVYHTAAFGHPLRTGYDFVARPEFATGMEVRYGLGMPTADAALAILFGSYRGLFYVSPVLVLAAWGLADLVRRPGTLGRPAALIAAAIVAYFVALNAGYYMWDGGAALGPRHCVPALPFLALGFIRVIPIVPRAFAVLGSVSVVQLVLATATGPEAAQHGNVLWEFVLDRWLASDSATEIRATNLGRLLGLPGLLSLGPLFLIWIWAWPRARAPSEPATER